MLEKIRTNLSIVVVIVGIGGSIAGAFNGTFVSKAEAEENQKAINKRLDGFENAIIDNTRRISSTENKMLDLQLTSLKGNYYILSGKRVLTEAEKLDLEIIKAKILELEKVLAAQ